jgi:hypothetical protein
MCFSNIDQIEGCEEIKATKSFGHENASTTTNGTISNYTSKKCVSVRSIGLQQGNNEFAMFFEKQNA